MKNFLNISTLAKKDMVERLKSWVRINTHCTNLPGLAEMFSVLEQAFKPLKGEQERIPLPPYLYVDEWGIPQKTASADALLISKRPNAPVQLLLSGHIDTVFKPESSFQKAQALPGNRLGGPGTADMKGGILIMLKSLELFEKSPLAERVGWRVILNPDEEIGSPSSQTLLYEAATTVHYGFIFEPAFPDGKLVNQRKASSNFVIVSRGKPAHVGRDFKTGRSAIAALAQFVVKVHALNDKHPTATLNIGTIKGGEACNIVPALASCLINVRSDDDKEIKTIEKKLFKMAQSIGSSHDLSIEVYPIAHRASKPFNSSVAAFFDKVKNCGDEMGLNLSWRSTGGVCDGNILAEAGLPTIDTLGAIGGNLHTPQEYIEIDSLVERTRLTTLLLLKVASEVYHPLVKNSSF